MPTEKVCRRLEFELCKEKDHCWESDIEVNKKEVPPCKSSHRKVRFDLLVEHVHACMCCA